MAVVVAHLAERSFPQFESSIGKIYEGQERTINSWEDDNIEKESRKGPFLNFRYINYILLLTAKFLP